MTEEIRGNKAVEDAAFAWFMDLERTVRTRGASNGESFASERDASSRLFSRITSSEEIVGVFSEHDGPQLSAGRMYELVWGAASAQWSTGHRPRGRARCG